MHFEGIVTINATREAIWEFLTNPNAVGECVPGLKSLEVIEPGKSFNVVAGIGFGSMKVTFTIDAEWAEMDPPGYAVMKAHGTAPGSAVDLSSEMVLTENADGSTDLAWSADVIVSGTIASLAARVMGGVAKVLTNQFFKCVKMQVET